MFFYSTFFFLHSPPCHVYPTAKEATKINSVESLILKLAFGGVQELGWGVETGHPVMI